MGLAFFNQMRRRMAEGAAQEPDSQPAGSAAKGGDPTSPADQPVTGSRWTLKQPPGEYLERYPDGKHADLAREIMAQQDASAD